MRPVGARMSSPPAAPEEGEVAWPGVNQTFPSPSSSATLSKPAPFANGNVHTNHLGVGDVADSDSAGPSWVEIRDVKQVPGDAHTAGPRTPV